MGFVALDRNLDVVAWNRRATAILGWEAEEVIGRPCPGVGEEEARTLLAVIEGEVAGRDLAAGLRTWPHADGSEVVLRFRSFPHGELADGTPWYGAWFDAADVVEVQLHQRNRLSRRLVEAIRIEEVDDVLEAAVRRVLGAELGVVLQPCPSWQHLHGERALGTWREDAERLELRLDETDAPWRTAWEGRVAVGEAAIGRDGGTVPAMYVPMGTGDARGVLLLTYPGGVPDEPGLPGLARALADEGWTAFERAALVAELEGKVEILEATAKVASTTGLDLDDALEAVCRHAAAALSCERAAIYLADDEGLMSACFHATDVDEPPGDGAALAREVVARGEPVLIQDTRMAEAQLDGPWCDVHGAVAVLGQPLRVAGRWIGVLVVAHSEANPRGFTALCQQVAEAVAQQAAIAIEHARLYATEQEAVRRLRELDQLRADYIAGISHDLRGPLAGLVGFLGTLRRLGESGAEEQRALFLDAMGRQASRLIALVDDLLDAAKLEGGTLEPQDPQPLDLRDVASAALDTLGPDGRGRVELAVPAEPVRLLADASQVTRVVGNLVENALKYSRGPVEVRVSASADGGVVAVRDEGPGIAPEDHEPIFGRFRRGRDGSPLGSAGLGLFVSRGIARAHGGDIELDSAVGQGSTFTLRLPIGTGAPEPASPASAHSSA